MKNVIKNSVKLFYACECDAKMPYQIYRFSYKKYTFDQEQNIEKFENFPTNTKRLVIV